MIFITLIDELFAVDPDHHEDGCSWSHDLMALYKDVFITAVLLLLLLECLLVDCHCSKWLLGKEWHSWIIVEIKWCYHAEHICQIVSLIYYSIQREHLR